MFLLDNRNNIVDAECSLDLLEGSPCIVVESSGGANPASGVTRRNPDYNRLLSLIFERLALTETSVTRIVLDSAKVSNLPLDVRTARLDKPYPVDLTATDIDQFRRMVQREIALMHRDPAARKGGNGQKRIRICVDKPILADQLIAQIDAPESQVQGIGHAPGLSATEREYLRSARIGQGQFRKSLLTLYGGACPITGITNPELLIASHIKPWSACSNAERLDPQNGIILSALIDRLFDRGLITFSEVGSIVISPLLSVADAEKCGLKHTHNLLLPERSRSYMAYHRTIEFKNA